MKASRKIRLSVHRQLSADFVSGAMMDIAYNVYGESELRSGATPTRPFVYILDYGVTFQNSQLPVIVIQCETSKRAIELGSTGIWYTDIALHIFGRNRGERDDISSAILEETDSFAIVDFDTVGYPTVETDGLEVNIETGRIWNVRQMSLPRELVAEETLANWTSMTSQFWTSSTEA